MSTMTRTRNASALTQVPEQVLPAPRLDQPDDQTADQRAVHVAQPTEDGDDERQQRVAGRPPAG